MPRKPKCRNVSFIPGTTYFKPAGIPLKHLQEEQLRVEEIEALRLKDYEGWEQETCAKSMGVSRPTFQRIITSAHYKLAKALVEGKAIRIEGGNYRISSKTHSCPHCNFKLQPPGEEEARETYEKEQMTQKNINCPQCGESLN